MSTLYSYCIPFDDGAAPNPFWGTCTLNICKPVIRRNAKEGDWIVGTGSKHFGFDNKVVYAMKVTQKLTMQDYEAFCKAHLPDKIPNWKSKDYRKRVGDCIYDFSVSPEQMLDSVHDERNRERDLGGKYTLLSKHFYYFGDNPEPLPDYLLPIVRQGQGHKSTSNAPYINEFEEWILSQTKAKNTIFSEPNSKYLFMAGNDCRNQCAARDKEQDDLDEEIAITEVNNNTSPVCNLS